MFLQSRLPTHQSSIRKSLVTTIAAAIFSGVSSWCPLHHRPLSVVLSPLCLSSSRNIIPFASYSSTSPIFQSKKYSYKSSKVPLHQTSPSSSTPSSTATTTTPHIFRRGDKIQVEVTYFGKLGASVDVIALTHDENDVIPESSPPFATGLILQSEIKYFRQRRDDIDVVPGEILLAYVERVREEEDGGKKLDISLRTPGYGKTLDLGQEILKRLKGAPGGVLTVGDKSSPEDIAKMFPGASKGNFKKAVAGLYKKGLVTPAPYKIMLMKK